MPECEVLAGLWGWRGESECWGRVLRKEKLNWGKLEAVVGGGVPAERSMKTHRHLASPPAAALGH